MQISCR